MPQISATISDETKKQLEAVALHHGLKKGYLIETALQHYLNAINALPPDIIIPPLIGLSRETGDRLIRLLDNPPEPTADMKALFHDGNSPASRG